MKTNPSERILLRPRSAISYLLAGMVPTIHRIVANLMRGLSMGEWLFSRRDRLIVARSEVLGNTAESRLQ